MLLEGGGGGGILITLLGDPFKVVFFTFCADFSGEAGDFLGKTFAFAFIGDSTFFGLDLGDPLETFFGLEDLDELLDTFFGLDLGDSLESFFGLDLGVESLVFFTTFFGLGPGLGDFVEEEGEGNPSSSSLAGTSFTFGVGP